MSPLPQPLREEFFSFSFYICSSQCQVNNIPFASLVYENVDAFQISFFFEVDATSVGNRSSVRLPTLSRPWVSTSDSSKHEIAKTKAQCAKINKFPKSSLSALVLCLFLRILVFSLILVHNFITTMTVLQCF